MHYSLNEQLETVPYTVICYIQVSLKEGLTVFYVLKMIMLCDLVRKLKKYLLPMREIIFVF